MKNDWVDVSYFSGGIHFKCLTRKNLPFLDNIVIDKGENQKFWHLYCNNLNIRKVLLMNAKNEDDAKLMALDYIKCMLYKVIENLENDS